MGFRVYTGQVSAGSKMRPRLDAEGIGELTSPPKKPAPVRRPFALDNGAWFSHARELPWDRTWFEAALLNGAGADFVVVPDIVAGGVGSLAFSLSWVARLAPLGLPLYLAVQDGMAERDIAPHLGPFAGLFVGGSTPWKLATGAAWVAFAHANGLRCHIGRVSTPRRAQWARRIGADSIDSTQPLWTKRKFGAFTGALRQGELL